MAERGDFYEDDEPVADVVRAFAEGRPAETRQPKGWFCEHMSITASFLVGSPTVGCGCAMTPLASV